MSLLPAGVRNVFSDVAFAVVGVLAPANSQFVVPEVVGGSACVGGSAYVGGCFVYGKLCVSYLGREGAGDERCESLDLSVIPGLLRLRSR